MTRRLLSILGTFVLCGLSCSAGTIIITGHDPDFHAQSTVENPLGAQNLIRLMLGAVNSRNGDVLFITDASSVGTTDPLTSWYAGCNGPCQFQSLGGIQAALDGTGMNLITVPYSSFSAADLSPSVGAVILGSDFGGDMTQGVMNALRAQEAAIAAYLANGGGMVVLSEQGQNLSNINYADRYSFLPYDIAPMAYPLDEYEGIHNWVTQTTQVGDSLTDYGRSIGLTDSDVAEPTGGGIPVHGQRTGPDGSVLDYGYANWSHVWFDIDPSNPPFPGYRPIDLDTHGHVVSFAMDVVPEPASFLLVCTGLLGFIRRRKSA